MFHSCYIHNLQYNDDGDGDYGIDRNNSRMINNTRTINDTIWEIFVTREFKHNSEFSTNFFSKTYETPSVKIYEKWD